MKKWPIAVAIMLILALFAGCTPGALPSAPSAPNPLPEPTDPKPPVPEALSLYDRLPYILADVCNMLDTVETIDLQKNYYVQRYCTCASIPTKLKLDHTTGNTLLRISTDGDREKLVYLLLLHTLTTEYADCVYFVDEDYNPSYSREQFEILFVSDSYAKAGYATVKDYEHTLQAGKCEAPSDAFYIYFDEEFLYSYRDGQILTSEGWKIIDLWPELFANAKGSN